MIYIITAPASSGQQAFSTQAFTAFVTTLLAHLQALIRGFTRYLPLIVPYGYCSSSSREQSPTALFPASNKLGASSY